MGMGHWVGCCYFLLAHVVEGGGLLTSVVQAGAQQIVSHAELLRVDRGKCLQLLPLRDAWQGVA